MTWHPDIPEHYRNQIVTGDCFELLPTVGTMTVDLVIADPPYSISTKSDGTGKINPWSDRVNASYWFRGWVEQVKRIIKPSGAAWIFTNWRSFVSLQKVSDDLGWPIESVLIWDKQWIGPGGQKGLRPSYELVTLWAGPDFAISNRGLPDIQAFKWSSNKPNGHPAEKPLNLIRWLIAESVPQGGIVCDPFIGSGTTGEAAANEGCEWFGFEMNENIATRAISRVRNTQPPLLVPQAEQGVLL